MTKDDERPPQESLRFRHLALWPLLALLRFHQWVLSPLLGRACRFEPSCSRYAEGCLRTHGAAAGLWYALRRLCRCHPFCAGGYDPVPPARPRRTSAAAERP